MMYDGITIVRRGRSYTGRRFLRMQGQAACQTVFFQGASRPDPVHYPQFAADDPAMNEAAARTLAELVDEAETSGRLEPDTREGDPGVRRVPTHIVLDSRLDADS